jgi:glycerophosphoryl diester phosphodiesterase
MASLDEYILICKKYEKVCVLELKSAFTKSQLNEIKNIFDRYGYSDSVIFISFGLQNLIFLKEIDPCVKAQFLTVEFTPGLIEMLTNHGLDIDIHHSALNSETVSAFKNAGIKINTWTCDDPKLGEQLANLGVDYITSNILE